MAIPSIYPPLVVQIGNLANSLVTGREFLVWENNTGVTWRVTAARKSVAATAPGTDLFWTIRLRGSDGADICTSTTAATSIASSPVDFGAITAAYQDVADGEALYVRTDHAASSGGGAGQALVGLAVQVDLLPILPDA